MTHTCNRCRSQYETGMFSGGHDYCMTCYVRIQDEEKRKRFEEERKKEERERLVREKRKEDLMLQGESERRRRQEEEKQSQKLRLREELGRQLALQKLRVAGDSDLGRHKHKWDITIAQKKDSQVASTDMAGGQPRRTLWTPPRKEAAPFMPGRRELLEKPEEAREARKEQAKKMAPLLLKAVQGLPVSLSVGQAGIKTAFSAKSSFAQKLSAEFAVTLEDSKKKRIEVKVEPRQVQLEPQAEVALTCQFDLEEDTNTGPLTLTAILRENAIYVDRESAKSEPVALSSQVKTPLELEYLPGSAAFEKQKNGTLALKISFENKGESGGFLTVRSSIGYGVERKMLRASLAAKAKVKGKQKKVALLFAPAAQAKIEALVFDLQGTDANGKEFRLQKSVSAGKAEKEKKEEGIAAGDGESQA